MTHQQWMNFHKEVTEKDEHCTGRFKVTSQHILNTIQQICLDGNQDTDWGNMVWDTLHIQFRGLEIHSPPVWNNESKMLLRSAYQIAIRNGKDTNWEAFANCVRKQLLLEAGHDENETDEQTILRATCTARTFRIPTNEERIKADRVGAHLTNE